MGAANRVIGFFFRFVVPAGGVLVGLLLIATGYRFARTEEELGWHVLVGGVVLVLLSITMAIFSNRRGFREHWTDFSVDAAIERARIVDAEEASRESERDET